MGHEINGRFSRQGKPPILVYGSGAGSHRRNGRGRCRGCVKWWQRRRGLNRRWHHINGRRNNINRRWRHHPPATWRRPPASWSAWHWPPTTRTTRPPASWSTWRRHHARSAPGRRAHSTRPKPPAMRALPPTGRHLGKRPARHGWMLCSRRHRQTQNQKRKQELKRWFHNAGPIFV